MSDEISQSEFLREYAARHIPDLIKRMLPTALERILPPMMESYLPIIEGRLPKDPAISGRLYALEADARVNKVTLSEIGKDQNSCAALCEKVIAAIEIQEESLVDAISKGGPLPELMIRKIRLKATEKQRAMIQEETIRQIPDFRDEMYKAMGEFMQREVTKAVKAILEGEAIRGLISQALKDMIEAEAKKHGLGESKNPLGTYLMDMAKREVSDYVSKNMVITFANTKGDW